MAETTKIQWCDATFNPWIGCAKVSPGCANCYAERDFDLRKHVAKWGAGQPRHRTSAANWKQPLRWDQYARKNEVLALVAQMEPGATVASAPPHVRPRVFCGSLCDWLDDEVPVEWMADLLDLIRRTPHLDWLLLTKRPENFWSRMANVTNLGSSYQSGLDGFARGWLNGEPPANVWIGTTVEDQQRADERIPALLKIPARVRFLSCEPLLGPVDLGFGERGTGCVDGGGMLDWVICGGESGPHARPMHPDWARSLRDQCAAAKVPFLFKQWDGAKGGKRFVSRLLDGREHNEFPEVRHG